MLGLDNSGKTTIIKKISNDKSPINPTPAFTVKTISFQGFKISIWDVGGQKSIRQYWKNYFDSATDGIVIIIRYLLLTQVTESEYINA